MHCYFSNGICNAEICLLLERAEKKVQITADNLCRQMQAEGWHRRGSENAHWCRRLWGSPLFGEVYKGSAAQTVALFLLLQWFALQWLHMPEMEEYCKCFLQLGRCVELLRLARHGRHHWDQLDAAQRKHQQMFASLYPSHIRPKHHHRLHLPACITATVLRWAAGGWRQPTKTTREHSRMCCGSSCRVEQTLKSTPKIFCHGFSFEQFKP